MYIIYYPEQAFGQNASVVQSYLVRSFPSPWFTYIMSKQGNLDNAIYHLLSSSSEVKVRKSWHRQRIDHETATTLKTNNTSYNTPQKEKITFKLNYLNNKKARYESHGTFITRCQKKDIISDGLKVYLEPSIGNHSENF